MHGGHALLLIISILQGGRNPGPARSRLSRCTRKSSAGTEAAAEAAAPETTTVISGNSARRRASRVLASRKGGAKVRLPSLLGMQWGSVASEVPKVGLICEVEHGAFTLARIFPGLLLRARSLKGVRIQ